MKVDLVASGSALAASVFVHIVCSNALRYAPWWHEKDPHTKKPLVHIPAVSPGIIPFLAGHFLNIIVTEQPGFALLRYCREATEKHCRGVVIRRMGTPIVVPSDPRDCLYVLRETGKVFMKATEVAFFEPLFGQGLFSISDRKEHAYHRRVLSPAFSAAAIKAIVMGAAAPVWQRFVKQLLSKQNGDGRVFTTLQHEISQKQLGIISRAAFRADDFERHVELTDFTTSFSPLMCLGPAIFNLLPAKFVLQQKALRKTIGEVVQREISVTRKAAATGTLVLDDEAISKNNSLAIIDHIALAPGVSDVKALDHSATLLLAGHETTASATIWVLYYLATNPSDQQLLFEELAACFNLDVEPAYDDIVALPFLRACIMEAQRVSPAVTGLSRLCVEDTVLPSGLFVPKGAELNVPLLSVNCCKEIWGEDADRFRPIRWTENEAVAMEAEDTGMGFVSFSVGSRNCIGKQMVMRMLQLSIAAICRKFELRYPTEKNPHPVVRKMGIGVVPEVPFVLELIVRKE